MGAGLYPSGLNLKFPGSLSLSANVFLFKLQSLIGCVPFSGSELLEKQGLWFFHLCPQGLVPKDGHPTV